MGPDDLDDLLASIRAEGKRDSALALYEGVGEEDLVDETIDDRVLKILGLNDVFDIDYGTYITLLKERLAASRSFNKKLSTEEDELLVEEFRKVKGKVGRFKIKRKKITADSLGVTGPIQISKEKFYLTTKAVIPDSEGDDDLKDISEKLDELIKSIIEQGKEEKKREEKERKEKEDKKRRTREGALEAVTKTAKDILKKIVAPFQSIFDRIMRFVKFTLLGFFLNNIVRLFADPANEKKIKVLGRFLKDWWPSLLSAYVLFATPFGKFVRGTLKLLRGFIPQMVRFMAAHPLVFAATTGAFAAGAGEMFRQKEEKRQIEREAKQRNVKPEVVKKELVEAQRSPFAMFGEAMQNVSGVAGGGRIKRRSFFDGSGDVNVKDIAFEEGGGISDDSGLRVTGAGPDTQLVATQPGEVVFSKKSVDYWGADRLLMMNKMGGGTNVPKMVNNIQLAAGGGLIGGFGRVMSPRTGGQNRFAFQGAKSVFQMFGLNVPGTERPAPLMGQGYESLSGGGYGLSPTIMTVLKRTASKGSSFVGGAFRNFGQNMKTIRGAARRQEIMMRQQGITPDGYVNLRGQPINLGPQSRSMPVGTPVISSKTQMIVLPPTTTVAKKPSVPTISGTQIPEFSIVANTNHRSLVSSALGISDLVG